MIKKGQKLMILAMGVLVAAICMIVLLSQWPVSRDGAKNVPASKENMTTAGPKPFTLITAR